MEFNFESKMFTTLFVVFIVVGVITGGVLLVGFTSFVCSKVGGWSSLAEVYGAPPETNPEKWTMETGFFGPFIRYRGALNFDADADGFSVSTIRFLRLFHATLRIPWQDVTITEKKVFFDKRLMVFTFSKVPGVSMSLNSDFGEKLISAKAKK